ncbi:MAG: GDP-mannose 4,6-dehydratase [archaeon]
MAEIMVTGGAGFIGSHLCEQLLNAGHDVRILDNFSRYYSGKEKNIENCLSKKNCELFRGDILKTESVLKCARGCSTIFHLAAQPGVRYSLDHPAEVNEINALGTLNVLEAARECDVERMVNASSSSVYGNVKTLPMREEQDTNPISPYGVSKIVAEHYCRFYARTYGMGVCSLRYFTVYGPRQRPDMAIRKFIWQIKRAEKPIVFGDGTQTRDFTYVSDIVEGTVLASKKRFSGDAFNIGGGSNISVNDLLGVIMDALGKKAGIEYLPPSKGDVAETLADITKAQKGLGYSPMVNIGSGIKKMVDWMSG